MKIKVSKIMKAKSSYSSQRETVVTSSFRACSFAMDDGGRCLLDVINDPLLLQSFLESGSDENSKDPQDGTSSESAVESPQVSRSSHSTLSNHLSSAEHIIEPSEMGYSYAVDNQGLLAQSGVCSTTSGLGGMSLVVAPSSVGPQTYQHASSSGATIHHIPSSVSHTPMHPHSPASARPATPQSYNIKSPGQGPSSVHSMPPPSPLQQTRSPLPAHTPSPAPSWSPAPPVLSPATSRNQSSMPSVAFQQSHNQILQTSCSVTQFVTAIATPQTLTQKLALQQQQQLFLQQQLSPASQQQAAPRLTAVTSPVVTTTAVAVTPPMVQLISAHQSNVSLPTRTSHSTVRPIQPKLPPQILPKPTTCNASNQFAAPAPAAKQAPPTPVTASQRTVGVGMPPSGTGQLVIGQGQPGVFSGPQGTIVLNQIIPGVGQSPILIQGNLSNLANIPGLQLTLRPPNSASPGQPLNSSNTQNNATLIAALQGPSQHAQTLFAQAKSPIHGQQTIVIPNNIAHAGLTSPNINLTSTAIPNSGIMSSSSQGQGFLARSNIILSPRVVGANQGIQLQQIQTPQGPIFAFAPSQAIAVPHLQTALQNATLGNPQLAPVTLPMHGVMAAGQGVISGLSLQPQAPQSALQQQQQQQSLFGTPVPFTSHLEPSSHQVIQVPQPLAPQQVPTNHPSQIQNQQQQIEHSPKPASPPKPSKGPSVNLEELLKEHGIVPENSPPLSPDTNSPTMEETVPSQVQATNTVVHSPQLITALQSQQVVLEQLSQSPQGPTALTQLKVAVAQDGSVIFHSPNAFSSAPRVQHYVSSGQMHGRTSNAVGSVILPTVTTSSVSVPVVTTEPTTARNHSALIARLNAGPAISVPDVSSLALVSTAGGSSSSSITTTTITTTTTTLVPLTVQSLNVNSSTIASSNYIVHRTNTLPTTTERVLVTEDLISPQNQVSSSSMPSVQNRINHVNSNFQTLVVPSEPSSRTATQNSSKTVQSSLMGNASTTNSQNIVQADVVEKIGHRETHIVEIADNGAIVPSHNLPAIPSNVPNQVLHKLQKEINNLSTLKYRSGEQQKSLQQLLAVQEKLASSKTGKSCRAIQNQMQMRHESEIEKNVQRPQQSQTVIIAEQSQQPQLQVKSGILPPQQQQHLQHDKQQTTANSKTVTPHNLHLVNLLKQSSSHSAPVKHIAPVSTSVATICDSTTATSAPVTAHQRVVSQIITPSQQRVQVSHQQCNKTQSAVNNITKHETTQQPVLVRMQKPSQTQPVQTCPNIKGASPVKRIVNTVPKTVLINEQLTKDQNGAVNPDVKTPFLSKDDACRRLLKYHVYNAKVPSVEEINKADKTFDMVSVTLLEKIQRLQSKYHLLRLKESMRTCVTPDQVLMERLFIEDEEAALNEDKSAVAQGKILDLPPPPESWLKNLKAETSPPASESQTQQVIIKQERVDTDSEENTSSRDLSDHHLQEDSDPLYKDDDNLEAPVIDSCADIVVPQHDDNCERSPPTLKRIVIKPEKQSESDTEEPVMNKRFKFNNTCVKSETSSSDWNQNSNLCRSSSTKHSDKEHEFKTNHKYSHAILTRDSFHSDKIDDMMTKIRKELNMSPMETDDDDCEPVSSHVVDFEPPSGTNDLADFEPPVARTEESCDSSLLYNSSIRTNCDTKYTFDMLSCPEWAADYVRHPPNESDVAVDTIIGDHTHQSDLDLSGLDGLDDHLEETQHGIPNGIQDVSADYIGYRIPKHQKRFPDVAAQPANNCSNTPEQVQSAIKSIIGTPAENRSYFGADEVEFLPLSKQSHNAHIADFGGSLDADMGANSSEPDTALDEAVRSILL